MECEDEMTQAQWIEEIGNVIREEAFKRGYQFPSAIIAQAILESNWGKSQLSKKYFNYFGLKCGSKWKGASVNMQTKEEYTPGTLTTIRDNFRVFTDMEDGVKGYFDFISTKRYQNLRDAKSPHDYVELLKKDGYFTSTTYVNSIDTLLYKHDLYRFDKITIATNNIVKTNEEIVDEVINGDWGNGAARKIRLKRAGYNPIVIQKMVNDKLSAKEVKDGNAKSNGSRVK